MRYSDEELSLIKNTFAENEDLLKVLRKVFLQIPLDMFDQEAVKQLQGKNLLGLLRKAFLPTIDAKAPLHQVVDLWMTLEIKGKTPEIVYVDALAREKLIMYLDQQLHKLEKGGIGGIVFEGLVGAKDKEIEDVYVDLIVRNTLISHVEMQISMFLTLAGLKTETLEETQKRLARDSSK